MVTAPSDHLTADAFSKSWNDCYSDSPYTTEQYLEWMLPLTPLDLRDKKVCELGCGHGGLLRHTASYVGSGDLTGVELGDSSLRAKQNLSNAGFPQTHIIREDLVLFAAQHLDTFDIVYCIGVIHHMKKPESGFEALVHATKPGGRFHGWVYAHEGNGLVRWLVEPIRNIACHLPWWLNKYGVALPLTLPFYILSKTLFFLEQHGLKPAIPLGDYLRHIGARDFSFHHHVAFDQLVTPQTCFIRKSEIEGWMQRVSSSVSDTYILPRNGNSWKFGGIKTALKKS